MQTLFETSHPEARASIIPSMTSRIRVGTGGGLFELDRDQAFPVEALTGKSLTALVVDGVEKVQDGARVEPTVRKVGPAGTPATPGATGTPNVAPRTPRPGA